MRSDKKQLAALRGKHKWWSYKVNPDHKKNRRVLLGIEEICFIIKKMDDPLVVDLGGGWGGTTNDFASVGATVVTAGLFLNPGHKIFASVCHDNKDKIIPVKGNTQETIPYLGKSGIKPDIVYIDADHRYASVMKDIENCYNAFPDAVLCGDDWTLKGADPRYGKWQNKYPVKNAVQNFAKKHGLTISIKGWQWMYSKSGIRLPEDP